MQRTRGSGRGAWGGRGSGGASVGRGVELRQNGSMRIFIEASDDGLGALWRELPKVVVVTFAFLLVD